MEKLDDSIILLICSFISNQYFCYCKSKDLINLSMTCKYNYNLLFPIISTIKLTTYMINNKLFKKSIICNIHNFQEIEYYENLKKF